MKDKPCDIEYDRLKVLEQNMKLTTSVAIALSGLLFSASTARAQVPGVPSTQPAPAAKAATSSTAPSSATKATSTTTTTTTSTTTVKTGTQPVLSGGIKVNMTNAEKLLSQGKWADAEGLFREALVNNPADIPATLGLGVALANEFKLDNADALFDRVIAIDPNNATAYAGKAMVMLNRLQSSSGTIRNERDSILKQAEDYAKRATTLGPANAEAHNALGQIYKEQVRKRQLHIAALLMDVGHRQVRFCVFRLNQSRELELLQRRYSISLRVVCLSQSHSDWPAIGKLIERGVQFFYRVIDLPLLEQCRSQPIMSGRVA
jgi:Flp pilus assembly protein TadD